MESINHLTRLTAAFLGLTILVLGIAAIWLIRMRKNELKDKKWQKQKKEGCFPRRMNWYRLMRSGRGSS